MRDPRRQIYFLILISLVILTASRIYRVTRPPSPSEELAPLREELALFRSTANGCNNEYAALEAVFLLYEARVDSLRELVGHYESLDPDGVPGEQYAEYLGVFDEYNAAVPQWEGKSDSLLIQRERCRSLTDQHNTLADSVRARLIELGRWPSDSASATLGPVRDVTPQGP